MSEQQSDPKRPDEEAAAATESDAVATADAAEGGGRAFSPEREERFQEIVRRYPTSLSAIMPVLWLCQDEWGWLEPGVPEWVAERLELPVARVYEVITFYTMYYLDNPGRKNLQVCRNISCHMMGARKIIDHIKDRLDLEVGQTSADGQWRLEEAECLGACGMAPMMQVGKHYYEYLTPEKVDQLIEEWSNDG